MARIQFADGTFTTRESHEVDPHVALPDNIEIVDHGHVVTTGLPTDIPQTALGVEFVEKTPEPEPAPVVHHRAAPKAAAKPRVRAAAKAPAKPAPKAAEKPAEKPADLSPFRVHTQLVSETDASGSVPQGRIGMETPHAAGGNPGRPEHPDFDDD